MIEPQNKQDQGGRPTKYRKVFERQAYQLALLGATDKMMAEAFGVDVGTINIWKKKHRGFFMSVREGKTQADAKVAAGLFKRATGFKYDEVMYERLQAGKAVQGVDGETEDEIPIKQDIYRKRVVTKYVPPDTGAATMWLKNRQKELWRDKQEVGLEFDRMDDVQVDQVYNRLIAAITKSHTDEQ